MTSLIQLTPEVAKRIQGEKRYRDVNARQLREKFGTSFRTHCILVTKTFSPVGSTKEIVQTHSTPLR